LGLKSTDADPCVDIDRQGKELIILLVYVDDILLIFTNLERIKHIKVELSRNFAIKDLVEAKFCLGIEIRKHDKGVTLSQTRYIRGILKKFGQE